MSVVRRELDHASSKQPEKSMKVRLRRMSYIHPRSRSNAMCGSRMLSGEFFWERGICRLMQKGLQKEKQKISASMIWSQKSFGRQHMTGDFRSGRNAVASGWKADSSSRLSG